jgi:predicted DNA-binding transcriptional regulator AlpA
MNDNTSNNPARWGKPLTLREVSQRTGASRTTVYRWMRLPPTERLGCVKINGFIRVWESQLADFLGRHGLQPHAT